MVLRINLPRHPKIAHIFTHVTFCIDDLLKDQLSKMVDGPLTLKTWLLQEQRGLSTPSYIRCSRRCEYLVFLEPYILESLCMYNVSSHLEHPFCLLKNQSPPLSSQNFYQAIDYLALNLYDKHRLFCAYNEEQKLVISCRNRLYFQK